MGGKPKAVVGASTTSRGDGWERNTPCVSCDAPEYRPHKPMHRRALAQEMDGASKLQNYFEVMLYLGLIFIIQDARQQRLHHHHCLARVTTHA